MGLDDDGDVKKETCVCVCCLELCMETRKQKDLFQAGRVL